MAKASFWTTTKIVTNTYWTRFLGLKRWVQITIGVVALVVLGGILVLARGGGNVSDAAVKPTVTVQSVDSFGDNSNGIDVVGTVQSISEADLLAQSAGTVEAVNTTIGASVPAGFVIASLDGSSADASVIQAQGAYDAALAAAKATTIQAQNTTGSLANAQTSVQNTYQSAYTGAESALTVDVDQLFGANTPVGPGLLIEPLTTGNTLPEERRSIINLMAQWQATLPDVSTTDPLTLLTTAQANLNTISSFVTDLSNLAGTQGSGATAAQLSAVAAAQSTINGLLANVSASVTAYTNAETAASVSQTQSSDSADAGVTSSQATVEEALGGLRAAQAAYEKTVVRAPIAGTVDFLPITVGDYVSSNEHVATVARNNALEVVLELSQNDADRLAVGNTVTINTTDKGIVTTIAPALDPVTQQIEVHVAVNDGSDLVDGQSVQVALPALVPSGGSTSASTSQTASTTSEVELPLTAVKLLPNERDVFSVDATGHLVAHAVDIGQVIGDRIQILTPLDPELKIVIDARGLSAGDAVLVSTSTPTDDSDDSE